MRRPVFWVLFAVVSVAAAFVAVRYFPRAFSIVALDITMDRQRALDEARSVMARDSLGPAGYRQAASFALDNEAQTFIELEGGGKDTFTAMLRSGLHSAYTWRVRQFKESDPHETTIRFTPEGRLYGFVEKLKEDAPGAALDAAAARRIAEAGASARWNVEIAQFALAEQGQERRVGGRVDHTLTYERPAPTLGEGRYRLRLVVSGDRLTEVTHFIRIPEAFTRRYANMRSRNEAIGIGAVVGMSLLYVLGGIGVGLFFMLRRRWVLWRTAVLWGLAVGLMQALATLNEFPLLWMSYDTALPRSTFIANQIALVLANFLGFSTFFALSFMAAESLGRRAFGHQPQLWRLWSRQPAADGGSAPGASVQALGLTVAALLLVSIFLAYDVMLYFVMTKYFGWWSPSEALLHPDVLATYAPWLSAISNSLQAGFWEEALFRAIPIAGAALIGDRLGQRKLFIVLAFVVQTLIFGAGHAPYPAQPSYARPVELIVPSIGFGLLYLQYGLLPGVILHYAFDAVLFSIPILLSDAPGIWIQQLIVFLLVLVPLWIVIWRRVQVGRWTELSPADRNAAWTPPPLVERMSASPAQPRQTFAPRARMAWHILGAAGLAVCAAALFTADQNPLGVGRRRAEDLTRQALAGRGITLDRRWRVMPRPDNGSGGPHEFVSETAGEQRRKELIGKYLPAPRWIVRVATFEGDVADRAEEWQATVVGSGEVRRLRHTLPEGRAGASLDETSARQLAIKAIADQLGLDAALGQVREVSARPSKLEVRTDWTFTFVDTTIPPLPQGEPRIGVDIAGDEVAGVATFVHVPEDWERKERATSTRNLILRILDTFIFGGLLLSTAVLGVMAWSRGRFTPSLFFATASFMLAVSLARSVNNWPAVLAVLPTEAPLNLTIIGLVGVGLVGLAISASLVGLVFGATPHRLVTGGMLPERDALTLGIALGLFAAAASAAAGMLRGPEWADFPNVDAAGALAPVLQAMLDAMTRLLMVSAVLLSIVLTVDQVTHGWTRWRFAGVLLLVVVAIAAAGVPQGLQLGGWVLAMAGLSAALIAAYVTLLRFDPTIVPLAVGTMAAVAALLRGAERAYVGALTGSIAGAVLVALLGWVWFRLLRRARARVIFAGPGL